VIMARVGDEARGYRTVALGETVTIASRLEEATKHQLTDCLISQDTLRAAGQLGKTTDRREIKVPGRLDPIVAYGLDLGSDDADYSAPKTVASEPETPAPT